MKLSWANLKNR